MSTEFERRIKALEKKIGAGSMPCPVHFPAVLYNSTDEEVEELLSAMNECPRCGPPKIGEVRLIVVRHASNLFNPLTSQAVMAKATPTHDYSRIAGDDGEKNVNDWPKISH
jgi:hypothetical protein